MGKANRWQDDKDWSIFRQCIPKILSSDVPSATESNLSDLTKRWENRIDFAKLVKKFQEGWEYQNGDFSCFDFKWLAHEDFFNNNYHCLSFAFGTFTFVSFISCTFVHGNFFETALERVIFDDCKFECYDFNELQKQAARRCWIVYKRVSTLPNHAWRADEHHPKAQQVTVPEGNSVTFHCQSAMRNAMPSDNQLRTRNLND